MEDALDTIIKILGHELIFLINMDKCYVCGQNRPCCRQAMQDIVDSNHVKVVRPLKGDIKMKWGLSSVRPIAKYRQ